jgi:hypothetical protein
MISVGGNFGQSSGDLDAVATGEATAVPSGSASINEGVLATRADNDSDEALAERGEGPGVGMKRRGSRRAEGRSEDLGEAIEMIRDPMFRRRSVSWQQR